MDVRREEVEGTVWVVKSATTPDEAVQIRHEASQLRRAAHPGVVELGGPTYGRPDEMWRRNVAGPDELSRREIGAPDELRTRDIAGPEELWTRDVGGPSLAELRSLPPPEVGGLGAAVATLLADLHDLGIVHGAVRAEHILLGPDGRPVLCGFGSAGTVGELDPDVDVRDLLAVLGSRIGPDAPRRLQRVLGRRPSSRHRSVTARSLASALAKAVPDRRLPTSARAATFDDDIRTVPSLDDAVRTVPSLDDAVRTLPSLDDAVRTVPPLDDVTAFPATAGPPSARSSDHRPAIVALPAPPSSDHLHASAGEIRTVPTPYRGRATSGGTARDRSMRRLCPRFAIAVMMVAAAVTGLYLSVNLRSASTTCPVQDQGCGPLPVHDGQFVTSDGRFAVGIPDAIVVVGRWECGAIALPAALDLDDGRVWLWPAWAGTTGTVTADAVTTRQGARSLKVVPAANACDRLEIIGPGRRSQVVEPAGRHHV